MGFRPHRGLFFYLLIISHILRKKEDIVSVPTGDFSFIYLFSTISKLLALIVSVPTGDFSFIY